MTKTKRPTRGSGKGARKKKTKKNKADSSTAPPSDELICELAELRPIDYDRRRKNEAKRFGIRVSLLDDLVKAERRTKRTRPTEPADLDPDLVVACNELAHSHDILERVVDVAASDGLVGESRAVKLLYLVVMSRLLDHPVAAKIEGPSSGGKSWLMRAVLRFFSSQAYYRLTGMSEKLLIYSDEPLQHRVLVIQEAAGIVNSEFAAYLMRELLSEGRLDYEFVQQTSAGPQPMKIEREGPIGLLVTTTKLQLEAQLETRILSVPITDSAEQTKRVIMKIAEDNSRQVDYRVWHGLQHLIADGNRRVFIPFAEDIAELTVPAGVRIRRDFGTVLTLVKSHALLHQMNRDTDDEGRIVATLRDYEVVVDLISDLIAGGVGLAVSETTRQTVETVARLGGEPTVKDVAKALDLDQSAAWRRVRAALESGYLRNLEERPRQPAKLVIGDPLPKDTGVLPSGDRLHANANAVQTRVQTLCR